MITRCLIGVAVTAASCGEVLALNSAARLTGATESAAAGPLNAVRLVNRDRAETASRLLLIGFLEKGVNDGANLSRRP
jgi:hypothetical protein